MRFRISSSCMNFLLGWAGQEFAQFFLAAIDMRFHSTERHAQELTDVLVSHLLTAHQVQAGPFSYGKTLHGFFQIKAQTIRECGRCLIVEIFQEIQTAVTTFHANRLAQGYCEKPGSEAATAPGAELLIGHEPGFLRAIIRQSRICEHPSQKEAYGRLMDQNELTKGMTIIFRKNPTDQLRFIEGHRLTRP
jgi:hypothetical protein